MAVLVRCHSSTYAFYLGISLDVLYYTAMREMKRITKIKYIFVQHVHAKYASTLLRHYV